MPKKKKSKAVTYAIPRNEAEVAHAIAQIGLIDNEILRIKTERDDKVLNIDAKLKEDIGSLQKQADEISQGVQHYCESNRAELTQNGKVKFHDFKSGEVTWRVSTKVVARTPKNIVEHLKENGLTKFLRVKESLNKEAMLEEKDLAATVPGITIKTSETFTIEPKTTGDA